MAISNTFCNLPGTRDNPRFAGAAIGIGYIFAQTIETVGRQPNAESRVAKYCWIGFALVEAIALYGLVVAFIIMGNI